MENSLKILDKKIIKKNNINIKLAISKNLIANDDYKEYQLVQSLYKKAFDYYLIKKTNIFEIDNLIKKSNLNFGSINKNEYDAYQKFSYLNSEFIYVRNFMFVEKLDNEEIKILKEKISKNDYEIDNKLLSLVENTYKDIIKNNYFKDKYEMNTFHVMYGIPLPSNDFENDILVLRFRYGKNPINLKGNEFTKNLQEKKAFLNKLKIDLQKEIKDKLNCKSGIIIEKVYLSENL